MTQQASSRPTISAPVQFCLILLGFIISICVIFPLVWFGLREFSLSMMQQSEVNWVLDHAYPNSQLVRADGQIGQWPAGSTVSVSVWLTFVAPDSFDGVKAWYVQHPEGGFGGAEGDDFPQEGLDALGANSSGQTEFRVAYSSTTDCGFPLGDCDRPRQQLR